jgi:hypothetical protein
MIIQLGNITPGEEVKIELSYTEELTLSLNAYYKFELPAKLNPTFLDKIPEKDLLSTFRSTVQTATGTFSWDFQLKLASSKKIRHFESASHKLRIDQTNDFSN